jgi:predicted helicase
MADVHKHTDEIAAEIVIAMINTNYIQSNPKEGFAEAVAAAYKKVYAAVSKPQ